MKGFIRDKKIASLLLGRPGVGAIFINNKGIIEYCDDEAREKLALGENLVGRHVTACHPARVKDEVQRIIEDFNKGEKRDKIEKRVKRGGFHFKNIYTPVYDDEDRYQGMFMTVIELAGEE